MPEYRLYLLSATGAIRYPPVIVDCADDEAALSSAREAEHRHVVEVWEKNRMVGRVFGPWRPPDEAQPRHNL